MNLENPTYHMSEKIGEIEVFKHRKNNHDRDHTLLPSPADKTFFSEVDHLCDSVRDSFKKKNQNSETILRLASDPNEFVELNILDPLILFRTSLTQYLLLKENISGDDYLNLQKLLQNL